MPSGTSATASWLRYPAPLREHLLHGSSGTFHLLHAASETLAAVNHAPASARQLLWHTGRELLLAAWEDDCCNIQLAGQLLELDNHAQRQEGEYWLVPWLHAALTALCKVGNTPAELRYYERLSAQGRYERCVRYLEDQFSKQPDNIWWLRQICTLSELIGDLAWGKKHLERFTATAPLALAPVLQYAAAGMEISLGNMTQAIDILKQIAPSAEKIHPGTMLAASERLGQALLHTGQRQQALAIWRAILRARPFHTGLALRIRAVRDNHDSPVPPAQLGKVTALLYSYNKAAELDLALTHLAHSIDSIHAVVALDNGSTDTVHGGTGAVINAWADRLGHRMQPVYLPVNIGAPAARNWLMHLPQTAQSDYVAYLDDDATVPEDWLGYMARAVQVYPRASVWGGKICDYQAPHIIQSADLHLVIPDDPQKSFAQTQACPFNVSDIHAQTPDHGQFDYIRPCISVTGCCHMFRTVDLLDSGDFSLMLSPSQYDDLEHDLRMAVQGRHACYTGFLSVRHMKRTGKATRMNPAQYGNGLGNKYKLHHMYQADTIARLQRAELDMLERDLLEALAE